MRDKNGRILELGDMVEVTPGPTSQASCEFLGVVKGFRGTDDKPLATIEDQDNDCFDCESSELVVVD